MTIEVLEFLQSFQNDFFTFFFNMISFIGEEYVYIVILGIVYYGLDKKTGEMLAFSLFITAGINTVIKGLVKAPRPFDKYPDLITNLRDQTSTGYSFPSGHTQQFTTFTFTAAFQLKKQQYFFVAGILSVLMALSRMYLGVHFLEDVTVSLLLGIIVAYLIHLLYKKYSGTRVIKTIQLSALIVLLPFLFIIIDKDFYTSYGLLLGFTFAMMFEQKYVNFDMNTTIVKKVLRVILGIVVMLIVQQLVKIIFIGLFGEDIIILDLIRYGLIAFVGLGLYPMVFKKFRF